MSENVVGPEQKQQNEEKDDPGSNPDASSARSVSLKASEAPGSPSPSTHSRTSRSDVKSVHDQGEDKDAESGNIEAPEERPADGVVKVPSARRRGLLGQFAIIAEAEEPKNYPRSTKWLITFVIAIAAAAAPMGSAIVLPALPSISAALDSPPRTTNFTVAFYMLSMSIFPLYWSSFSETLGRRTIYLVSFALSTLFSLLSAISSSIGMLIAMRMLAGGAAASVQAVGAGTVADIWESKERGTAMGIFYLGPLCGPFLAPILGGVLAETMGWRSTQWFLTIYGGVLTIAILLLLPETLKVRQSVVRNEQDKVETEQKRGEQISTDLSAGKEGAATNASPATLTRTKSRDSVKMKTRKWASIFRRLFIDPLSVVLFLRYPPIALSVYYASITFGSLYFLNISIQQTFSAPPYSFSTIIVGLLYIPNSIGYILASLFGGRWVDYIMHREAKKAGRYDDHGNLIFRPEDRMRENAWFAAVLFPCALLAYGWTAEKGVFWLVPMIMNFFFGVGSMLVFATITTMLTEFMPGRSSSGVAVNNLIRNIFSFLGALLGEPLINAIGDGWLFTILGIVALLSGSVIWAMKRWGPRWREEMDMKMGAS